jgi:hypothetical protein
MRDFRQIGVGISTLVIALLVALSLTGQTLTGFTLINADTERDIGTLTDNQVLNLSTLPTRNLNIRANTDSVISGSITFAYDTIPNFKLENNPPYSFAGDILSNYNSWTPTLGSHTIKVSLYAGRNAGGALLQILTINFLVIDEIATPPSLRPVITKPTDTTITQNQPITYQVIASDPDTGAVLTYFASNLPDSLTIDSLTGLMSGTVSAAAGSYTVNLTVKDQFDSLATASFIITIVAPPPVATVSISGEFKKWHRVTLTFDGPSASETSTVNPFLNYRLDVTFTHNSGKSYKVPGYFAADGDAAETSDSTGTKWRVHFSPDETGSWTYRVSFRQGDSIAVSDDSNAGVPLTPLNDASGTFTIAASDKTGKDLRAKGLLKYVGQHYLQFSETGEYFVKAGADSPENFLAYQDFDNTRNNGGRRKSWAPHVQDWLPGDPTWQSGKGKGIIGAINYLSAQGMNVFSFLTMNIKGDDQNVFPYLDSLDFIRMDVSKLDQWEIIFEHAQKMGMYLHFKLQEVENNNVLDGGNLGIQRKLYLRELIARYAHHLALNWNIGEENTQTDAQRKAMAKYIYDHDPYKHHIVIHTYPSLQEQIYRPLLGDSSAFAGVSIQTPVENVYAETRKWVEASANLGKKWVVANDEQNPFASGVAADAEYTGNRGSVPDNSERIRRDVLWGNLMAGGGGVEYYFGYNTGETDLTSQDYRSREKSWKYAKYALDFFKTYLPLTGMKPLDNSSSGWSFGKEGDTYVVYLKAGGSSQITLPSGKYTIKWYNPGAGGELQNGSTTSLDSGTVSLGNPPSDNTSDWAVLIRNSEIYPSQNAPPTVSVTSPVLNSTYNMTASITISADAADTDGLISKVEFYNDTTRLAELTTTPYNFTWNNPLAGSYSITAKAFDNEGASTTSSPITIGVNQDPSTTTGDIVFAINAGGAAFRASNGITYQADQNFTGGSIYFNPDSILNTADDSLYQTERFGNFSYSIPLTDGKYEISFRFAEIYQQTAGKRQFDVLAEGIPVISNLDIFAVAGYKTAFDIERTITVEDGMLNIDFNTDIDNAKLAALHVKALQAAPASFNLDNLSRMSIAPLLKSLKENIADEYISIYPNPSSGLVTILSDQNYSSSIKVYNSQGKKVYSNQFAQPVQQINLSPFGAGVYYIHIQNSNQNIIRKVIVLE